mmetsp:Transcript_38069/g.89332  ORF Transcript_38069/g.89332 Transcript_38069/m.89332 type:complete len:97 (+) Transcript_38069:203-493(+)
MASLLYAPVKETVADAPGLRIIKRSWVCQAGRPTRSLHDEVQPGLCGPALQRIRADDVLVEAVVFEAVLLFTAPQVLPHFAAVRSRYLARRISALG